ncbi:Uncharacterised protein [Mycobacteroides abscessus subsp. abscessus]|nr:Uncharacterised protein [Mycobacteroides abscessus subsp. abscessus]
MCTRSPGTTASRTARTSAASSSIRYAATSAGTVLAPAPRLSKAITRKRPASRAATSFQSRCVSGQPWISRSGGAAGSPHWKTASSISPRRTTVPEANGLSARVAVMAAALLLVGDPGAVDTAAGRAFHVKLGASRARRKLP